MEALGVGLLAVALAACDDTPAGLDGGDDGPVQCSIPNSQIQTGARRDGIPALTNPETARSGEPGTEYLLEDDRVIGIVLEGEPLAIPLNILWWHEVVNLDGDTYAVTVSHCPLTGSSLAFDRRHLGDTEFGVSGLLFQNNLIMYDRSGAKESLWPQMLRGARCGYRDGESLPMVPIIETTWGGWTRLHPDTKVVTSRTDYDRNYRLYPYGNYDRPSNGELLFPLNDPMDRRRPPKERVLGIPVGSGGIAYPFGLLEERGDAAAVHGSVEGTDYVILWESERQGAMAYRPVADGQPLTFNDADGRITDAQTGSTWRMDGVAVEGPLAGSALEPIADAFVAFWFAWPAFYPDIELWSGP